ncbi:MAG TPA: glycerol-3-phosphate dehydrogenase C-terminal domain-containing protein, partial [Gemmatimonadaceae bacterium]|nr:glycerol-3-phosphate dehydrogenase C-terminal domain-containing protein [Gemmatimonadaceae bacterium]
TQVWASCAADDAGRARLAPELPYLAGELRWGVTQELALTLGDLLIRRVPIAFDQRDHGLAVAPRAAAMVAPLLGWSGGRVTEEVGRFREETERMFRIDE